ncbi:hypothetical protein H9L39_01429 [Fusarium oxysporum f. sp. albedinis]|nr:hypothetical protein H9L39_01429 [Fusarium oxysporum f. sp. albedinis]
MVGSWNDHELRARTSIAADEHYSRVVGAQRVLSCPITNHSMAGNYIKRVGGYTRGCGCQDQRDCRQPMISR